MWGPGAQGGFQNALAMGLQVGQMVRQGQDQREYKNALAQFDPSNPETLKPIMAARPEVGLQLQRQVEARQAAIAGREREGKVADLSTRFLDGDEAAGDQLAQLSLDDWMKIEPRVKAAATEEAQVFGNAALDLLNMPYEARRGQVVAYAQQFPEFAEQINNLAFLPPAEQDAALRGVVADAKMIDKLIQMERPSYQAVGVDQDLVNVRDPEALRQFDASRGRGGQQAMPSISDIDAELRRRGVIR